MEQSPSPGKYNPNYDSVFRYFLIKIRKVPNVIIMKPNKKKELTIKVSSPKIKDIITQTPETILKEENTDNLNKSFKLFQEKRQAGEEENLDVSVNQIKIKRSESSNKNKSLRFSKYSQRKDSNRKWSLPILSYIEPVNYLSTPGKGLDFSKMKERNFNDILNSNISNPGVCYYQPKYDLIYRKSPKAIFHIKDPADQISNKNLIIQKLWRSYEVSSDYKTVKLVSPKNES